MTRSKPAPTDLMASEEWIRWKFGMKNQPRGALVHVNQCLRVMAAYERSFLLSKAGLLEILGKRRELKRHLVSLGERYPDDPEVLYQQADYYFSRGILKTALSLYRKAEPGIEQIAPWLLDLFLHSKLDCLVALGRLRQASIEASRALQSHPGLRLVKVRLKELQDELGVASKPRKQKLSSRPKSPRPRRNPDNPLTGVQATGAVGGGTGGTLVLGALPTRERSAAPAAVKDTRTATAAPR